MENGNKSAYPVLDKSVEMGVDRGLELKDSGLTKREIFAMTCLGHAVDKWYNHTDEELVARSIKPAD